MGTSTDEIDREIASTREHLDDNLDVLESRAVSGARRAGIVAALGVAGGLVGAGVAYLLYRRFRRPALAERMRDLMPGPLASLPDEVRARLKHRPVRVVISDTAHDEPGTWEAIGRKVAPAVASTAVSAVMARALRRRQPSDSPETPEE